MMKYILGTLIFWSLGLPLYLPWVLARVGIYKRWYFAPFVPPFSWRGWIQLWPMSALFVCFPVVGLLPLDDDLFMKLIAGIGITGIIIAFLFVIWTPRWAKPGWQRRLEDRYSYEEINRFIQSWKKMDFKEWGQLIETEEGLEELVRIARGLPRHKHGR